MIRSTWVGTAQTASPATRSPIYPLTPTPLSLRPHRPLTLLCRDRWALVFSAIAMLLSFIALIVVSTKHDTQTINNTADLEVGDYVILITRFSLDRVCCSAPGVR